MSSTHLKKSDFDSAYLGIAVAKISGEVHEVQLLEELLRSANEQEFDVVFLRAPHDEASNLQYFAKKNGNFCCLEVKYTIELNDSLVSVLSRTAPPGVQISEYAASEPTQDLIKLSLQAGHHSRFRNDPNISYQQFEHFYASWVHNCTKKQAADVVFTATDETNRAVGFAAVRKEGSTNAAKLPLLAVHPEHRRRGIGKALIVAALKWLQKEGIRTCEIVTQKTNSGARNLCEACGGLLVSTSIDIHFWMAKAPFNDALTSDIPGNKPYVCGGEFSNLEQVFISEQVATHGKYGKSCQQRLESELGAIRALLVTSGTSALELCSLAINTKLGDEIIMPSYTFVSTANAFVNHGGIPVFVDIRRDTQNIDERKIESAITSKTKAIVVVHYAGVPCEMDTIMSIARRHGLYVIEDNAHGIYVPSS